MLEIVGRDLELEEMERRYSKPGVKTLAVWGRRRVGKTFLIQQFCKDKPHILLTAVENSYTDTLRSFDTAINRWLGTDRNVHSESFSDILQRLKEVKTDVGRMVIVIDEYPYVCEQDPSSNSYLQMFIDHDLQEMDSFLIVCGSAIKTMERILTDGKGALYKRFIGPMKIEPLSYKACREFHPGMSEPDMMRLFMVVGGIPLYHLMMNEDTFEGCVKNNLLGPYAPLREEADFIISRELEPVSTNLEILRAISDGHTSGKEIAEITGQTKENCYTNLKNMSTIGIVSSLNPMCGANKKERIYRISDNLIRFSNEVLVPNSSVVSDRDRDLSYSAILPYMQTFFGQGFEYICKEYVREHHRCKELGSWWGKTEKGDSDIDIVALCDDGDGEFHLVCECKFRNKESGMRELKELQTVSGYMRNCYNKRFCIFSRSGFTDDLMEYAESLGITLLTPEDMYGER